MSTRGVTPTGLAEDAANRAGDAIGGALEALTEAAKRAADSVGGLGSVAEDVAKGSASGLSDVASFAARAVGGAVGKAGKVLDVVAGGIADLGIATAREYVRTGDLAGSAQYAARSFLGDPGIAAQSATESRVAGVLGDIAAYGGQIDDQTRAEFVRLIGQQEVSRAQELSRIHGEANRQSSLFAGAGSIPITDVLRMLGVNGAAGAIVP